LDGLAVLERRSDGCHADVAKRKVEPAGRRNVHGPRHGNPAEPKARDLFARRGLLQGVHQNLDGVLLGSLLDDLERGPHDAMRIRLLAGVVLRAQLVVNQLLHVVLLVIIDGHVPVPAACPERRQEAAAIPVPSAYLTGFSLRPRTSSSRLPPLTWMTL